MSKFSIKIMDKVFESNEDGMLDLNDIRIGCNLPDNKIPNQWRSKVSQSLFSTGNLQSLKINNLASNLPYQFIAATEVGAIAYAMWVSPEFYLDVVNAFVALRNGQVEEALAIASNTLSEADAHYLKRQMKLKGLFWDESCAFAGIKHPRLCKQMLLNHERFNYFDRQGNVADNDKAEVYFYNRGNKFTSSVRLCVTPEGRMWLRDNAAWFNKHTEAYREEPNKPF